MELMDAIKKRRSIRKFQDKEVSDEIIEKIIGAARWAPSGMNIQPWSFITIKDKEKLKKIRQLYQEGREKLKIYAQDTSFVENTSIILVCSDKTTAWAKSNCHYAIQNILLAATDLGLGSLCLGALMIPENIEKLRQMCSIPENIELVMPLAIGYADEAPEPTERKDIKEILHYEKF